MSTTLNGADLAVLAQEAIEANLVEIEELKVFSTTLETDGLTEGDQVKVPVYGATTAIAFDRATENYGDSQDQTIDFVGVVLDQHIKSTFEVNDSDLEKVDMAELMRASAHAVVKQATLLTYGEITAANYTQTPVVNVIPSAFDSDLVADLSKVAKNNGYKKPLMVLNSDFATALKKDPAIKDASASGSTATLREGQIGKLSGFDPILESVILPENGEDLAGFITDGTALAVASAPVRVKSNGSTFAETFIDPTTGLAMTFRMFYNDEQGVHKGTFEMLFGFKVTRSATLQRITDATV
jgi:hypothetical protein